MRTLDYYFAPASPWTYLGHSASRRWRGGTARRSPYKPCDFGRVFSVSGGLPLAQRPKQRQSYRLAELKRWRDFLGVPLNISRSIFRYRAIFRPARSSRRPKRRAARPLRHHARLLGGGAQHRRPRDARGAALPAKVSTARRSLRRRRATRASAGSTPTPTRRSSARSSARPPTSSTASSSGARTASNSSSAPSPVDVHRVVMCLSGL